MLTALVIGGGSIGKRHLRNLLSTGRTAAVVETREDRRAEIAAAQRSTTPSGVISPASTRGLSLLLHELPQTENTAKKNTGARRF